MEHCHVPEREREKERWLLFYADYAHWDGLDFMTQLCHNANYVSTKQNYKTTKY